MRSYMYVSVSGEDRLAIFEINDCNGRIHEVGEHEVLRQPYPLAVHPSGTHLYVGTACAQTLPSNPLSNDISTPVNKISTFVIDPDSGQISLSGMVDIDGDPCYFSVDKTGQYILSAYYFDGKVEIHHIGKDRVVHGPKIQDLDIGAGAHSFQTDPSNRFAYAPCIAGDTSPTKQGGNSISQFAFDSSIGRVSQSVPFRVIPKGSIGPRHFCFNPNRPVVYFSNEQGCSLTAYSMNASTGSLTPFQTISTLSGKYMGANSCSQIQISPSGEFLYAPNRGENSVACFKINEESGGLTHIGNVPTEENPRALNIDPTGRFLYVAGESSGRIASYMVNQSDGTLDPIDIYDVGKLPMWVLTILL